MSRIKARVVGLGVVVATVWSLNGLASGPGEGAELLAQAEGTGAETSGTALADGYGPLSDEARAIMWGSAEDPPPEILDATREELQGRHYLFSDELHLELFQPSIAGIGGGYAGVGSDQAYLFIGWMRANLAWLTDYDPWIKALHRIYFVFFEQAPDIDTFLNLWDHDNEDTSREIVRAAFADDPELDLILEVYEESNRFVHQRLRWLRRYLNEIELPSFVNDEETYTFVRDLILAGRVRPMLANLLDDEALVGIGQVGEQLGVPLRALYLSNAEEYWSYTDQFRTNMSALYFDDRSVILRARSSKPLNNDYCYNVQPSLNFRDWLAQDYVRRMRDIWGFPDVEGPEHFPFEVVDSPPRDR